MNISYHIQILNTGLGYDFYKCLGRPIHDRWLTCVQFHDSVVHSHTCQRADHMLHCVNLCMAGHQGSVADKITHIRTMCRNFRRPWQIHPPEHNSLIGSGRKQLQSHTLSRMEGDTLGLGRS
ncbi:MAG: hypothetical protein BWY82_02952 [Verrucomicrobia bacterium ADurb.Bin474]|nr:MAG: hypothetical protein BWY82_02952 [Verrucomicrobia bacterium ADurb.Bin474]